MGRGRMEGGKERSRKVVDSGRSIGIDIKLVIIEIYPRCVGVTV